MSKINVLYSFPLRFGTTGTGMTAWHQVNGLLEQDVHVMLFAGSCEKEIHGLNGLKETLLFGGAKLPIRLIGVSKAAALHDRIVAKAIRQVHKEFKIDIIHCWPLGSLQTLRVAKVLGIKTFLERPNTHTRYAYEVVKQEYEKLRIKSLKSDSHTYDAKRLQHEENEYHLADYLLCPSDFVAETFLAQGITKEKIALHQYGYDPKIFAISPSNDPKIYQNFKIAFVGMCEPRKGLHYALDAWLQSEATQKGTFYICGKYRRKYRKLLAEKLSHPSIKELGFSNNVYSLLQQCHALILPSIEEGSALVTYEARACGCVLIVSDSTGSKCTHMQEGLIHKAGDVTTLTKHINLLCTDHKLYQKLRTNSLLGLSELTWTNATEVLLDIYKVSLKKEHN